MSKASIRQPLIISFTYDYANRRVGKRVQEKAGGQWLERYHHLYVYNGTQPVAEIDASTRRVLRTFAWGATGELLMIHDRTIPASPQTYLPVRDASGSVTALVRDDGNSTAIVAVYEYDPNGNLLRAQGEYAKKNPFTFGGGWMDWETGLVSAGSVYYSARLGRFINTGPSGSGDGLVAYYGVAPTVSCLPLRQYARPEALLRFADPGFTIDSPEWLAYEAALAAAEAESVAQDGYLGHNLPWEPTETEDNLAEEFIAEAKHFQFTSVLGSIDHGLSDAYLIGTDPRKGGAYIEYYSDGSMMAVNTLGSTLLIENDGTATLNFSNTQLSIIQAPSSGDRITMKRIDAAENLGIDPRSIIKTSSGNIVIQTTTKSKYVAGNDQFRFLFGEPATSLNKANAKGVTAITGKASMVDGVLKVDLDITVYLRTYLTSSHGDTTLMPKFGELQHVQDYWDAREGLIPLLEKSLKMNIPESVLVNVIEGYFDKARKQTIATWDAEGKPHAPGGVAEVPSNFSDYPASWWK